MNFYLLLVAILAFSTSIDAATFKCYTRDDKAEADSEGTSADCVSKKCYAYYDGTGKNIGACDATGCGTQTGCKECAKPNCNTRASIFPKCYKRESTGAAPAEGTKDTACSEKLANAKCVSYYDASGNNLAKCLDGGCAHVGITTGSLHCKDCLTDNCNVKSLIQKCYVRNAGTTSGDGTSTNCATTMANPKCVSYFDADGKNFGECKDGGCGKQTNCKECTGENCNKRSLIRKCYERTASTGASNEGIKDKQCNGTPTDAKCIAYTKDGKNLAKCNDGGCTSLPSANPDCKDCTTNNCNVRALIATTAAPTTPRAAATRASVGWQTGIMAASVCVLVLIKPF